MIEIKPLTPSELSASAPCANASLVSEIMKKKRGDKYRYQPWCTTIYRGSLKGGDGRMITRSIMSLTRDEGVQCMLAPETTVRILKSNEYES